MGFLCLLHSNAKSIKKIAKEEVSTENKKEESNIETTTPQPAIVAIEIVDNDADNATLTKNTKRTIESSLGYGYNSGRSKPRYEIYKYSQQDIPPVSNTRTLFVPHNNYEANNQFHIQKSIAYNLGSTSNYQTPVYKAQQVAQAQPQPTQYYQPGTTLFSTLNHQGQLGQFSQQIPQQQLAGHHAIPVIVLRVYTKQLSNAASLYPNLPQTHPYSNLNSIDLQSLLSGYVQNMYQQYQQNLYQQQPQTYQTQAHYTQPDYQTQAYQYQQESDANLQTHENYPDEAHTRVIFHKQPKSAKETETVSSYQTPNSYSGIQFKTPDTQYVYTTSHTDNNPGYYYAEEPKQTEQQQVYIPQYEYQQPERQYHEEISQVQATENSQPGLVYSYQHHDVNHNQVEVLTHEGKGPQVYQEPQQTRKARRNRKVSRKASNNKKEE